MRPLGAIPASLHYVDAEAPAQFAARVAATGIGYELREHEHTRHARHLAAVWGLPLPAAGRATLFQAGARAVLVLMPADRKVSAPRLRDALQTEELRVLRGDRGVGRLGWNGLPGLPGPLPAVPALFAAASLVDSRVLAQSRIVVALDPQRSIALAPADYIRLCGSMVRSVAGRTRLLPEGGMVVEELPQVDGTSEVPETR
jgi:prolyl-tRNA editing enzyme YbaK/EbsC (Cys-tRNA(Pro) deacylase)